MKASPLREFVLAALLWLPLCFFLWFVFSGAVIWPAAQAARIVLPNLLPQAVESIEQIGASVEVVSRLSPPTAPGQRVGVIVLTANPMVYAWCIPLFAGLVAATPLGWRRRLAQLAGGVIVLLAVVSWGTLFEVMKLFAFDAGPLGAAAIEQAGWSLDAVALAYQFGYLILPSTTPVIVWILLNAHFLEALVGWSQPLDDGAADSSSGVDR